MGDQNLNSYRSNQIIPTKELMTDIKTDLRMLVTVNPSPHDPAV